MSLNMSLGKRGIEKRIVFGIFVLPFEGSGKIPSTLGLESWHNKYTNENSSSWTKIYRHEDGNVATAAAAWERNTYRGKITVSVTGYNT